MTVFEDWKPVILLGLNKSATTSLHGWFQAQSLKSIHWDSGRLSLRMFSNLSAGRRIFEGYEDYQVFSDMTFVSQKSYLNGARLFAHLRCQYPNALFVLNVREKNDWLGSRHRHRKTRWWKPSLDARFRTIFGVQSEDVDAIWAQEWVAHHDEVRRFFDGDERFLEFNPFEQSITVLQVFLRAHGVSVPHDLPLPAVNVSGSSQ